MLWSDFEDEEGLLLEQLAIDNMGQSPKCGDGRDVDSVLDGVSQLFSAIKDEKAHGDTLDVDQIGANPVRNDITEQSPNLSFVPIQNNCNVSSQSLLSNSPFLVVPEDCFAGKSMSNSSNQDGLLPLPNNFVSPSGQRGIIDLQEECV